MRRIVEKSMLGQAWVLPAYQDDVADAIADAIEEAMTYRLR